MIKLHFSQWKPFKTALFNFLEIRVHNKYLYKNLFSGRSSVSDHRNQTGGSGGEGSVCWGSPWVVPAHCRQGFGSRNHRWWGRTWILLLHSPLLQNLISCSPLWEQWWAGWPCGHIVTHQHQTGSVEPWAHLSGEDLLETQHLDFISFKAGVRPWKLWFPAEKETARTKLAPCFRSASPMPGTWPWGAGEAAAHALALPAAPVWGWAPWKAGMLQAAPGCC